MNVFLIYLQHENTNKKVLYIYNIITIVNTCNNASAYIIAENYVTLKNMFNKIAIYLCCFIIVFRWTVVEL